MSLWGTKPFLAVQVLGPDGYYPRFQIRTPTHRFEASDALVWTAVLQQPLPDEWELSEVPTLIPEEIRLLAAVSLCARDPWYDGVPTVTRFSGRREEAISGNLDLTSDEGEARIQSALKTLTTARPGDPAHQHLKLSYSVADFGSAEDALNVLANCDMEDELLLAGLANLHCAARLLSARVNELEAAALCMFVSMGAALEFIRQHLNEVSGSSDTSFAAVHEYLGTVYPKGNFLPEYLEEIYEHRLIATHPAGRLGEFWTAPLMVDDIYDLRKHLIVIYRHIILGENPQLSFDSRAC